MGVIIAAWLITAYFAQRWRGQRDDLAAILVYAGLITLDDIESEES